MIKLKKPTKPKQPIYLKSEWIDKEINITRDILTGIKGISLEKFLIKANSMLKDYKETFPNDNVTLEIRRSYGGLIEVCIIVTKKLDPISLERQDQMKKDYLEKMKKYNYELAEYYKQKARELNEQ